MDRQLQYTEKTAAGAPLTGLDGGQDAARSIDAIIDAAVERGASDIHLEPAGDKARVRLRIDGLLHTAAEYGAAGHNAAVARLKVMSGLDIGERRLPQDGRMEITVRGRRLDLRISTLPALGGEKMVLRLLEKKPRLFSPDSLDFSGANLKLFRSLYSGGGGMVLLTGPTGSGKTTALYAALSELNREDVNIVAIEDPVEYRLDGITQVGVSARQGLTFAAGLRAIVRQDPDIIMVGEIRDGETAGLAVHAAMTGHLVFSTMHAGTAAGAIVRLREMGVEPCFAAAALRGAVSQRLVRRVCAACREWRPAQPLEKAYLGRHAGEALQLARGRGCPACGHTGYSGRIAVQEVLAADGGLADLIAAGAGRRALEAAAAGRGSLYDDGRDKVMRGLTTVGELLRAGIAGEAGV